MSNSIFRGQFELYANYEYVASSDGGVKISEGYRPEPIYKDQSVEYNPVTIGDALSNITEWFRDTDHSKLMIWFLIIFLISIIISIALALILAIRRGSETNYNDGTLEDRHLVSPSSLDISKGTPVPTQKTSKNKLFYSKDDESINEELKDD